MSIIITISLFIIGMISKRSKCIYFLQFCWMWILMSFCENIYRFDYQNYLMKFYNSGINQITIINSEFGYTLLNKFFYMIGMNFEQTNMIFNLFILSLIAYSIPKYTTYITVPSSLYLIYPLFINGVQIRNSLSSAIIIFSIQFLLESDLKSTIKFIVCVLLATTLHTTSIVYVLLVVAKYFNISKIRKITAVLMFSIYIIQQVFSFWLQILFGEQRYIEKFAIKNTISETLFMIVWQLSLLISIILIKRKKNKSFLYNSNANNRYDELVIKVNVLMLIIMPLYYLDFSVERLVRNLLVINFIYFAEFLKAIDKENKNNFSRIETSIFLGWFMGSAFIFEGWYADHWKNTVLSYLNQNMIVNHTMNYILMLIVIATISVFLYVLDVKKVKICNKRL